MSQAVVAFDAGKLLARPFPVRAKRYDEADVVAWARDFGAGLGGSLIDADQRFLDPAQTHALPMIAVPLCDGDFWQQQPDTGIVWQQIVHAEEVMTLHRPLPSAASVRLSERVVDIRDRGAARGALMVQRQTVTDDATSATLVEIDVTTVLRGNGGYGGPAPDAARPAPLPERKADATIDVRTPSPDATRLCLSADLAVAAAVAPGQRMLRGVGCFGLAGRAVLAMACGNEPTRLKRFGVRYGGPMLTDETMRVALWFTTPGEAVFRMNAVERDAVVLSHGTVSFDAV